MRRGVAVRDLDQAEALALAEALEELDQGLRRRLGRGPLEGEVLLALGRLREVVGYLVLAVRGRD